MLHINSINRVFQYDRLPNGILKIRSCESLCNWSILQYFFSQLSFIKETASTYTIPVTTLRLSIQCYGRLHFSCSLPFPSLIAAAAAYVNNDGGKKFSESASEVSAGAASCSFSLYFLPYLCRVTKKEKKN